MIVKWGQVRWTKEKPHLFLRKTKVVQGNHGSPKMPQSFSPARLPSEWSNPPFDKQERIVCEYDHVWSKLVDHRVPEVQILPSILSQFHAQVWQTWFNEFPGKA